MAIAIAVIALTMAISAVAIAMAVLIVRLLSVRRKQCPQLRIVGQLNGQLPA